MANNKDREQILEEKLKKIKEELNVIKKKNIAKERKARTKRLIELGANIESKFSPEAVLVLRYLPKDKFKPIENWLLEHKDEAEKIKAEEEAKKQEKQKAKEEKKASEPQRNKFDALDEKLGAGQYASEEHKARAKQVVQKMKSPAFGMEEDEEDDFPDFSQNSPGSF